MRSLAVAMLLVTALVAQDRGVVDALPLAGICTEPTVRWLPNPRFLDDPGHRGGRPTFGSLAPDQGDVIALVERVFTDAIESGRLSLTRSTSPWTLLLRGDAAQRDAVRALLTSIEAQLTRSVELEIAAWGLDREPGEITTGWRHAPPAGMRLLCVARGNVRLDAPREFERSSGVPMVRGRGLPTGRAECGLRALAIASAVGDETDALFVDAEFAFGELRGAPRPMRSEMGSVAMGDGAEVAVFTAHISGRVVDGEALVAWSLGDAGLGPRVAISVRARWLDPPPVHMVGAELLPLGALHMAVRREQIAEADGDDQDPSLDLVLSDQLASRLTDATGTGDRALVARFGSQLVVIGETGDRAAIRAALDPLVARWCESLEHELVTRDANGGVAHRVVFRDRAGAPLASTRGRQRRRPADHAVDGGMTVRGPWPVIDESLEGVDLRGRVDRLASGWRATLQGRSRHRDADRRRQGRRGTADLELGSLSIDDARYDAAIERGVSVPLGAATSLTIR